MKDLSTKVAEIMSSSGEEIELFRNRHDDGTPEEPDIVYDRFIACVEELDGRKTVGIYISKEDNDTIYIDGPGQIYRFPLIDDKKVMERMFAEIVLKECE